MSKELNEEALLSPKVGDYWHERYRPYFFIVEVQGNTITILNCIDKDNNAMVDCGDYWVYDYSKGMKVDRSYLEKCVKYEAIDGFVSDVVRSDNSNKNELILNEWLEWKRMYLVDEINKMQLELEGMI